VAVIVLLSVFAAPCGLRAQTVPAAPAVLVLYDNEGQWGWLGEMYSLRLTNLLSHFNAKVTKKGLGSYVQGDMEKFDATFYVGSNWSQEALPVAFQTDLVSTTKTFVWAGINLWRYAWDPVTSVPQQTFITQYGFSLLQWSGDNHPTVTYKATVLKKDPYDMALCHVQVLDPTKAVVRATCQDAAGVSWPYILQCGKFWYIADNPLISTIFENRSLAFEDLLHDMLGVVHAESHRANVRIEDISMATPTADLTAVRKALTALKIPFAISLIPEYHDLKGVYNNGVSQNLKVTKNSALAKEMLAWVKLGGQILQHGTTHNMDGFINPYSGVSGDDYEFYRATADSLGHLTLIGPVPGDSATWARARVLSGQTTLKNAGLTPVGWLTPHYLASPVDYVEFAKIYKFACDRSILYVNDSTGKVQALELNSPYVYTDTYGIKRIPESCGWIDLEGWLHLIPPTLPADIIQHAKALKVVRDSWAGFYYHTYVPTSNLTDSVNGLKALGYTFVPLSADLK